MNNDTNEDFLPMWEDTTLESLNLFIESQCSQEEVYALLDLSKKEIELKYKIEDFDQYFNSKQLAGLGRLKARCFSKALEGDAIMLRHLTQDTNKLTGEPALTVSTIALPDNTRIKSK